MAYKGSIIDVPVGSLGLVQRDNRLSHQPGELVDANGLTLEDGSFRKERGASLYDPNGVTGAPAFTGTLASSDSWSGIVLAWPGSGIATSGTPQSTAFTAVTATQLCSMPTCSIGDLLVVVVRAGQGSDPDRHPTSVTDSAGNVYTLATLSNGQTYINHDDGNTSIFYSLLTFATTNGVTLMTVNFSAATVGVIVNGGFSGITSGTPLSEMDNSGVGTAVAVGPLATIGQVPVLVVCGLGTLGNTDTPGSSFTEFKEQAGSGAAGCASLNYRVDTTTPTIIGLQDWDSGEKTTPAGTVTTVAGSAAVVGVGTTFTAFAPGDKIVVAAETHTILSIADATNLTTTDTWRTASAGVAFDRVVGARLITATQSGNLFKDKPTGLETTDIDATTLKSGLSLTARPGRFVVAGKEAAAEPRKLFYFNGVDPVQVLQGDGTTTAAVATGPSDWDTSANPGKQPINGTNHANRVAAWGNLNDPHRVYFSDPDDHEVFTGGASFNMRMRSDIGERIWCGVDYQGVLFVWKYPRGIFYLDDSDLTPANWFVRTKSEALGCAPSPYAVLPMDDDVMFMAADGSFHILSAVDTFGGLRTSNLGLGLGFANWIEDNVNLSRLDQVTSVWYPQRKVALFGVPGAGDTTNTLTLKFDFSGLGLGKPVIFTPSRRDNPDAFTLRRYSDGIYRPIFGEAGHVYLTEQAARNKNGQAYQGMFQTAHESFSYADVSLRWAKKHFEFLQLVMEPVAAGTMTATVYVDGAEKQTLSFDATKRRHRLKLNVGAGYDMSVKITNSVVNEDFNVVGMAVWATLADRDQNR